jgi:hypothetical protein
MAAAGLFGPEFQITSETSDQLLEHAALHHSKRHRHRETDAAAKRPRAAEPRSSLPSSNARRRRRNKTRAT